jgi:23S rRNA (uracil-5-)-methyltransferase RumA
MILGDRPRVKTHTCRVEITLRIDRLDDDGRGVGTAAGLEVRVAGALPGETVRAKVQHESPHAPRAWADLVATVGAPSEERVPVACPGFGECGGCALQHLAYPAQLTYKRRLVEGALAALNVPVADVVPSAQELHYRNKAKYVIAARDDGGLRLGSYAPGSHRVVDMAGCQVPEEPIDAVARAALKRLEAERLPAYDERRRTGELRYLVVRASADGELLVVVVAAAARSRPALVRAARAIRAAYPAVVGVVLNVNTTTGGAIFGAEDIVLDGAGALADRVGDVRLELSARAFFQINRAQAARLYAHVARAAAPRVRAVDLYSGVGGIALTLAQRGARVVAVETAAAAVADARRSATANGLHVDWLVADAAAGLSEAARRLGAIDLLVVNPPRKGLATAVRAAVQGARAPRVIYVSCGPHSLAADLAALVGAGYRVADVQPFDLMPGTPQVETVAVLER